jgi:hypothetical protein
MNASSTKITLLHLYRIVQFLLSTKAHQAINNPSGENESAAEECRYTWTHCKTYDSHAAQKTKTITIRNTICSVNHDGANPVSFQRYSKLKSTFYLTSFDMYAL